MRTPFLVLCVAITLAGCKSREEKLKAAEEEGNLLVATKARLLKGAGEAVKKEGKEAAEALAEGSSEVVKGLGSGIEKGLKAVKLSSHEGLAPQGITATRAARGEDGAKAHSVSVYVAFEKAFKGTLELRVYDGEQREVGRTKAELDEKESGARYVDFTFDPRTPILTAASFELRESGKKADEAPKP